MKEAQWNKSEDCSIDYPHPQPSSTLLIKKSYLKESQ